MKTVNIIERIEGEAKLNLFWKNEVVSEAYIEFLNFRGFEYMLEGKAPMDALVYTPRMCGICGQAHLLATVNALEDIYKNANIPLQITPKAKALRELGLIIEIIQSHIKWFYFFIMPDINKNSLNPHSQFNPLVGAQWLKAQKATSEIIKALAIYAGQWPHTSYMIPGGVVSDPTLMDMTFIENYIDQTIAFFEEEMVGTELNTYLSFNSVNDFGNISKDVDLFLKMAKEQRLESIGKSYNKFIVISDALGFTQGKIKLKNVSKIDLLKIEEFTDFTFDIKSEKQKKEKYSWSKSVQYENDFYETGPLSRALVSNNKFIRSVYKEYEDSVLTRVLSRIDEIAVLLNQAKEILHTIDISQPSFIQPLMDLKEFELGFGRGSVEATRGSLKHEINIENGLIKKYDVITPTVWNLGPGNGTSPGVAQKAIIGSKSLQEAIVILRSFDVCSVCTTH
ncbi:MAG: nickel-dependent hydrogenase large subunit [Candidatus Marinarcus sp.]|uniref:nickel-dependent hydrogenase large subunit n=1 Tax=Candidatus Marinarcus sp. TaxID=3100987 RepID=UPI003B00749E